VLTWALWENFRFASARLRKSWPREYEPRVALFAPCKGLELGLIENLRPLFEQEYANYSLTFIVESADDAVCNALRGLMADYARIDSRLLVAGLATHTGQKVHNLRAATARLADDVEVLAFVDSDAQPRRDWLRRLVARLSHDRVGVATGYRWFRPTRPTAAQALVYGINSRVAASLGPGGHHLIWGGSWAIRRELFDQIDLRGQWEHTLSDDLVASRAVRRAGLSIDFEPACMVTSPLDGGWRQSLEFVRRQYLIARAYAPAWWMLALVGSTLPVITFWGGLAALALGLYRADTWSWLPAVICPGCYATMLVRGYQRWLLGRLYVPEQSPLMKRIAWLDIWTGPLVALVNWLAVVSSLFGNHLRWRGIDYKLGRRGRVVSVHRNEKGSRAGQDVIPKPHHAKSRVAARP
ncbi:MAG: glycosyltransferase, partial [Pirellulales bacterium]